MIKDKKKLTILFFIVLGLLVISYIITVNNYVVMHENAHHRIFANFNVNSTIQIYTFGLDGGVTIPNSIDYSKLSPENKTIVNTLNSVHELYDYQITTIIDMFFISLILLTTFIYGIKLIDRADVNG